ncbi:MAG: hypothetical protein ACRC4M_05290 [Mycoplasma sp.]
MSSAKKVFKLGFGIAGAVIAAAGLSLTITGAVLLPTTNEDSVQFSVGSSTDTKIGTGTKNWFESYKVDTGEIDETWDRDGERDLFIEEMGAKNKKEAVKKFLDSKEETYSPTVLKFPKSVFESIQKNTNLNVMSIAFLFAGPASLVASIPLMVWGFKKEYIDPSFQIMD